MRAVLFSVCLFLSPLHSLSCFGHCRSVISVFRFSLSLSLAHFRTLVTGTTTRANNQKRISRISRDERRTKSANKQTALSVHLCVCAPTRGKGKEGGKRWWRKRKRQKVKANVNYGVQSFCPLLTTADFVARREDVEEEEVVVGSSALSLSHHFFPPSLSLSIVVPASSIYDEDDGRSLLVCSVLCPPLFLSHVRWVAR